MNIFKKDTLLCKHSAIAIVIAVFSFFCFGCNKLVQIPPPVNSITTSQVFSDSSDIAAAIFGIYSQIQYGVHGGLSFCNGAQTIYCGLSSDELVPFRLGGDALQIYQNKIISANSSISQNFWSQPYKYLYQVNACIEGLQGSKTVSDVIKNRFIGEAKFLRALFDFYLVNLYGDIPNVTSTAYTTTSLIRRTSKSEIYQQIVADLKDAQNYLPIDYTYSNGQRTRANQWAATALLARVYLYMRDWGNAAQQATAIINNSNLFTLTTDLNGVFLCNSSESILQWQLNTSYSAYTATSEGLSIVPFDDFTPQYYISNQLLNSFEPNDQRRSAWLDSVNYLGKIYFAPYKYKIGTVQYVIGGNATEYYTVLRLAEQYLIRAEAELNGANGGTSAAIADLNVIRNRAGLPDYSGGTDQSSVQTAIMHERRIELFAEWGHRWLDLKRTGQVDSVMAIISPQKIGGGNWNSYQQLYPIPQNELRNDPNLTQNPGY